MSLYTAVMVTHKPIEDASSAERKEYLRSFLKEVFQPQRAALLAYREHTNQSAQVDSDGYLAEIVAGIVTGVPGHTRRGKSGDHPGDLSDGTEVKSAYRVEQMNRKEDSHVNFGQITRERMREFLDRERAIVLHTSYDVLDRVKIEVLELDLDSEYLLGAVEEFLARSSAKKPQLQPRLYPDNKRDRLQHLSGHMLDLGATLLARAVMVGDDVAIDKWAPDSGLELTECLDVYSSDNDSDSGAIFHEIDNSRDPDEFFSQCMVKHRQRLIPYCDAVGANQNVGFGNLAQHLVTIVTGKQGTGSGARGPDLVDGSEIKLAMGLRGDPLGTEDYPRLNLQNNVEKILEWPHLYPVRIICDHEGLKVKVFEADPKEFREQVRDYFGPDSKYRNSANMQYHVPKDFNDNTFTGERGDGSPRVLECRVLYHAEELPDGECQRIT